MHRPASCVLALPDFVVLTSLHPCSRLPEVVLVVLCVCVVPAGGLFDIMAPSFGTVDLHLERAKAGTRRR